MMKYFKQYQIQRSSLRVPLTVSQKNNAIIGLLNVDMNNHINIIINNFVDYNSYCLHLDVIHNVILNLFVLFSNNCTLLL